MSALTFRWTHKGDQYEFNGRAQTSRAQCVDVEAELLEIWRWLTAQKLSTHLFDFHATRRTQTVKDEVLTVSRGQISAEGSTSFPPVLTEVRLRLPEAAAVQFRFAFQVLDDRG